MTGTVWHCVPQAQSYLVTNALTGNAPSFFKSNFISMAISPWPVTLFNCICVCMSKPVDRYLPPGVLNPPDTAVEFGVNNVFLVSLMQCLYIHFLRQGVSWFWKSTLLVSWVSTTLTRQSQPWDINCSSTSCCLYQLPKQYWNTLWILMGCLSPDIPPSVCWSKSQLSWFHHFHLWPWPCWLSVNAPANPVLAKPVKPVLYRVECGIVCCCLLLFCFFKGNT